jgi:hypothetical protein
VDHDSGVEPTHRWKVAKGTRESRAERMAVERETESPRFSERTVRRELVRPGAGDEEVRMLSQRLTPGLAGYVGLIILGLVLPH